MTIRGEVNPPGNDEHLHSAESDRDADGESETNEIAARSLGAVLDLSRCDRLRRYLRRHAMFSALFALVAAIMMLLGALRWRRVLVMSMPFLVIFNGVPLVLGGVSVRVDQVAACLLLLPLMASILSGRWRLRMDVTAWWLTAILAMNLVASALNSPVRSYSLLQCANLASVWVIYLVLINFLATREDVRAFFTRSLWAAVAAGGMGVGAFLLALAGLNVGGAEVSRSAAEFLTSAYGAFGTMVEPNLFGSFMGAYFILAISLLALAPRRPDSAPGRALLRWTAALCAIGLLLSFTRSAWLGVIATLVAVALLGRGRFRLRATRLVVPVSALLVAVAAIAFLPGDTGTLLRFKLTNLVNLQSQTVSARLVTYALALEQTVRHPIVGWGTFTFAPLVAEGSDFARYEGWRNLWIGNYLLLALHDTGVIGLVMWIFMLWSMLVHGTRAARELAISDPVLGVRTLALTLAVASLLISFLSTSGFSLGFPWLLIGLLGAHARLAEDAQAAPLPAQTLAEPLLARSPAAI